MNILDGEGSFLSDEMDPCVLNSSHCLCPPMQAPLRGHTQQLWPRAQADRGTHQVRSIVVFTSLRPDLLSAGPPAPPSAGPLEGIFMKESEASNFFRRRSRRGLKSQDEINGEFRRTGENINSTAFKRVATVMIQSGFNRGNVSTFLNSSAVC